MTILDKRTSSFRAFETKETTETEVTKPSSLDQQRKYARDSFPMESFSVCTTTTTSITDRSISSQASSVSSSSSSGKPSDENDDDDALSVASSTSADDKQRCTSTQQEQEQQPELRETTRRSIFRHYWEKCGRMPFQVDGPMFQPPSFVPAGQDQGNLGVVALSPDTTFAADQKHSGLRRNGIPECSPTNVSGAALSRRSIIPRHSYASTPSLLDACSDVTHSLSLQRKTLSSSQLQSHQQQQGLRRLNSVSSLQSTSSRRSCLRQSRYSGPCRRSLSENPTADSSVSFDSIVNVQTFERPLEQHALPGWSKNFTS